MTSPAQRSTKTGAILFGVAYWVHIHLKPTSMCGINFVGGGGGGGWLRPRKGEDLKCEISDCFRRRLHGITKLVIKLSNSYIERGFGGHTFNETHRFRTCLLFLSNVFAIKINALADCGAWFNDWSSVAYRQEGIVFGITVSNVCAEDALDGCVRGGHGFGKTEDVGLQIDFLVSPPTYRSRLVICLIWFVFINSCQPKVSATVSIRNDDHIELGQRPFSKGRRYALGDSTIGDANSENVALRCAWAATFIICSWSLL